MNLFNQKKINLMSLIKSPRELHKMMSTQHIQENDSLINKIKKEFSKKYKIIEIIYADKKKLLLKICNNMYIYIVKIYDMSYDPSHVKQICDKLWGNNLEHIISDINVKICSDYWYIIYEYYEGIPLNEFVKNNKLSFDTIKNIFLQITQGVHLLHQLDIIHCDIKLENVIVGSNNKIKIIDFDLSKNSENSYISESMFGTHQYMSPESYDLNIHSKKSDVWELGVLLFVMVTNEFPFVYDVESESENSYENLYGKNKFRYPNINKFIECMEKINAPSSLLYLVNNLLSFEDFNRFTTSDILHFVW